MRLRLGKSENPVIIARHSATGFFIAAFPTRKRSFGLTFHKEGGLSVVGVPQVGGTTICWGTRLKQRMAAMAEDCVVYTLGPIRTYSGRDF
jgi:hypothetical protein